MEVDWWDDRLSGASSALARPSGPGILLRGPRSGGTSPSSVKEEAKVKGSAMITAQKKLFSRSDLHPFIGGVETRVKVNHGVEPAEEYTWLHLWRLDRIVTTLWNNDAVIAENSIGMVTGVRKGKACMAECSAPTVFQWINEKTGSFANQFSSISAVTRCPLGVKCSSYWKLIGSSSARTA